MFRQSSHPVLVLFFAFAFANPVTGRAADNPMESVGIAHNQYLDCLRTQADSASDADAVIRTLFRQCGYGSGIQEDLFVRQYGDLLEHQAELVRIDAQWPLRGEFSQEEFEFLIAIQQSLLASRDAPAADAALARLEDQANDLFDPRTRQGQAILAGLATARHSVRYWSAFADQNAIPYAYFIPVETADWIGSVIGTVAGGPHAGVAGGDPRVGGGPA